MPTVQPIMESDTNAPGAESIGAVAENRGAEGRDATSDGAADGHISGRDKVFTHWWLLGISTTVIVLSFLMSASEEKAVYLPLLNRPLPEICFTKRTLNLDCPGCGMTRCFINLSHGNFVKAWQLNLAGVFLYGLIAFQIPFQSLQLWRIYHRRQPFRIPNWEIVFYALAAMMIVTWGAKLVVNFLY